MARMRPAGVISRVPRRGLRRGVRTTDRHLLEVLQRLRHTWQHRDNYGLLGPEEVMQRFLSE